MENNEIRTPRRLFEELIERNKKIYDAQKFITEEEAKFEEIVSDARKEVKINQSEIKKIRETRIRVGAESLLEEIAKELNVNVDNLLVNIEFLDTERSGKISRNKFIKLVENESFDGSLKCVLAVECKTNGVDETMRLVLPLNLDYLLKDGKKLKEFLEVETKWDRWAPYTDFKCPDYKNLIFVFNYENLVSLYVDRFEPLLTEFKPLNKKCELILNAYERECEKEADVKPLHIV